MGSVAVEKQNAATNCAPEVVRPLAPRSIVGHALTARQRFVCDCILQGLTNKEIASAAGIKKRTVAMHLNKLYLLFGVRFYEKSYSRRTLLAIQLTRLCYFAESSPRSDRRSAFE